MNRSKIIFRLFAALVVLGTASWTDPLGARMRTMLTNGDRENFNKNMNFATRLPSLGRTLAFRSRPYPHADWFDLYTTVAGYTLDQQTVENITTPLLITDPGSEQFWRAQSARLADMLGDRAALLPFSGEDGASFHCQPTGRLLAELAIFDWLNERLTERL